jgi:lambda family phage minor tail protein L
MQTNIHKEIMELEPSALVVLFEVLLKDNNNQKYYFHAGENGYQNDIYYKNNTYLFHPIKAEGFDFSEDSLPRPTLTADNTDSFFSLKTRYFKDFIGYEVRRIRTFVKFLHGNNFPNNLNPFGSATEDSFPVEKYIVNKKTAENSRLISFELASPLEKERASIPNRKIQYNVCPWIYRSTDGCGYTGKPVQDSKGNTIFTTSAASPLEYSATQTYSRGQWVKITNKDNKNISKFFVCLQNGTVGANPESDRTKWVEDACSKSLAGCRARFKDTESVRGLPFGGFPGSWK